MTNPTEPGTEKNVPRRKALDAYLELVAFSILSAVVAVFAVVCTGLDSGKVNMNASFFTHRIARLGDEMAPSVVDGVYVLVGILLAIYALVVGGSFAFDGAEQLSRVRRNLGLIAESLTAMFSTSVMFVAISVIKGSTPLGIAFVLLPIFAVSVLLTLMIGVFVAITPEKEVANALETQGWAERRMIALSDKREREMEESGIGIGFPIFLVAAPAAFVGGVIGAAEVSWTAFAPRFLALLLVGIYCAGVGAFCAFEWHASRYPVYRIFVAFCSLAGAGIPLSVFGILLALSDVRDAVAIVFVVLACLASAAVGSSASPWKYSVQESARRLAYRKICRMLGEARAVINADRSSKRNASH